MRKRMEVGIPEKTLRNWVYLKKIPYSKVNRLIRFDKLKIDDMLNN